MLEKENIEKNSKSKIVIEETCRRQSTVTNYLIWIEHVFDVMWKKNLQKSHSSLMNQDIDLKSNWWELRTQFRFTALKSLQLKNYPSS